MTHKSMCRVDDQLQCRKNVWHYVCSIGWWYQQHQIRRISLWSRCCGEIALDAQSILKVDNGVVRLGMSGMNATAELTFISLETV